MQKWQGNYDKSAKIIELFKKRRISFATVKRLVRHGGLIFVTSSETFLLRRQKNLPAKFGEWRG
jgi:hypothetical protein